MAGGQVEPAAWEADQNLLTLGVNAWRYSKLAARMLSRFDPETGRGFAGQLRFLDQTLSQALEGAGLRIVDVSGQPFDAGMAASVVNLADFENGDELVVDAVMEPIVMGPAGLLKTGVISVKKAHQ